MVVLSSVSRMTTMSAGLSVVASIGVEKRTVIGAIVEKPSSWLIAAALRKNGSLAGVRSVPSVEPLKYRSVGYGRMPWPDVNIGWNVAGGAVPVEPPLPVVVSVGTPSDEPRPELELPRMRRAATLQQ